MLQREFFHVKTVLSRTTIANIPIPIFVFIFVNILSINLEPNLFYKL